MVEPFLHIKHYEIHSQLRKCAFLHVIFKKWAFFGLFFTILYILKNRLKTLKTVTQTFFCTF